MLETHKNVILSTWIPNSSRTSRLAHSSSVSPNSKWPPADAHVFCPWDPLRSARRILPSLIIITPTPTSGRDSFDDMIDSIASNYNRIFAYEGKQIWLPGQASHARLFAVPLAKAFLV